MCYYWRLATGNLYRTISKISGDGKATAVSISKEFNIEIVHLAPQFIQFPKNGRETNVAIQKFHAYTNCAIPNVSFVETFSFPSLSLPLSLFSFKKLT